jgi:hypothetical protein
MIVAITAGATPSQTSKKTAVKRMHTRAIRKKGEVIRDAAMGEASRTGPAHFCAFPRGKALRPASSRLFASDFNSLFANDFYAGQ